MAAPKSVIKIKKDGVSYESSVDAAQYYIHELSRAAMRDVGKFIKKKWQEGYDRHFKRISGEGRKATKYTVFASKKTEYPRVDIGLDRESKGFYAYYQEFGTKKPNALGIIIPALGLLTHAAQDNIPEIIKIESQYLSALGEEAERLAALVSEEEYDDDEE